MNMFSDAARQKTEEARQKIHEDYARDTAQHAKANEVLDDLANYLVDHPALQRIDLTVHGNVVILTKTETKRVLSIICSEGDAFTLEEKRPDFQSLVTGMQPALTLGRIIDQKQMTREVTSWLAA